LRLTLVPVLYSNLIWLLHSSEESNYTSITKISVPTPSQSRNNIAWNKHPKRERETNNFHEIRQLAYVLGVEGRRSYSNNWVTRVTKQSKDSN